MTNDENAWPGHWRRFIVDVLIGTSTIAVALATGATSDMRYLLLIVGASALVAIALTLEPQSTRGGATQSPRVLNEADVPTLLGAQRNQGFDVRIADATSV